jgi:hypothetical protein
MTIDASHQKPLTYVKAVCRPGRTIARFLWRTLASDECHERKVRERAVNDGGCFFVNVSSTSHRLLSKLLVRLTLDVVR